MADYFVNILKSEKDGGFYSGYTTNLKRRLAEHNSGKTKSLRNRVPLSLIYYERYPSKSAAKYREEQIKRYKGGEAFKRLLGLLPV